MGLLATNCNGTNGCTASAAILGIAHDRDGDGTFDEPIQDYPAVTNLSCNDVFQMRTTLVPDKLNQGVFFKSLVGLVVFDDQRPLNEVGILQHESDRLIFGSPSFPQTIRAVRGTALIEARIDILSPDNFF